MGLKVHYEGSEFQAVSFFKEIMGILSVFLEN